MPVEILMPALSPTMTEGNLARWLKQEGETVSPGDILAEIETDKATMEIEAIDEGTLGRIVVPDGTEGVSVNTVIALLLMEGEDSAELATNPAPAMPEPHDAPATTPLDSEPSQGQGQGQGNVPPPPVSTIAPDPDVPAGTEMVELTVREALRDAMAEEMRRDPDVFLIGEEVAEYQGAYKVSQGLLEEFGARRVIDTPITEAGFTGLAIGAGFAGLKPIVEFMTFNFAMQAIDQILNSAAKTRYMSGGQMGCSIVFRGPNGAAAQVGAQHSQSFAAWYAQVPGIKVVAPYDAADSKALLKAAIRDPNPVLFLENEMLYGRKYPVPQLEDHVLPIGRARVVRPGRDVTIVAYSIAVGWALETADRLAGENIDAEVIDLRSLRPLDIDTVLSSLSKTNRVVTVEEGWPICSIGSEISAQIMELGFDDLDAPVTRVAGKDVPMPYAANLEKLALPSINQIVDAVRSVCYRD